MSWIKGFQLQWNSMFLRWSALCLQMALHLMGPRHPQAQWRPHSDSLIYTESCWWTNTCVNWDMGGTISSWVIHNVSGDAMAPSRAKATTGTGPTAYAWDRNYKVLLDYKCKPKHWQGQTPDGWSALSLYWVGLCRYMCILKTLRE